MDFDGQDDYVNVPTYPQLDSLSEQYTISCWIKRGVNSNGKLFANIYQDGTLNAAGIELGSNGVICFGAYGDGSISGECAGIINDTDWHHIVGTFNNSTVKVYKNGIKAAEGTLSMPSNYTNISYIENSQFQIGRSLSYGYCNSKIDEVAIWKSELSEDDIIELFNSGNPIDASSDKGDYDSSNDLIGYWRMNQGEGSTLEDASSLQNQAIIYGATWSDDAPMEQLVMNNDLDYQNSTDSLLVSWLGSDEASGIASYEYALGSQSINDVVDWTDAGLETSKT